MLIFKYDGDSMGGGGVTNEQYLNNNLLVWTAY
jgi:hypothetical protein